MTKETPFDRLKASIAKELRDAMALGAHAAIEAAAKGVDELHCYEFAGVRYVSKAELSAFMDGMKSLGPPNLT